MKHAECGILHETMKHPNSSYTLPPPSTPDMLWQTHENPKAFTAGEFFAAF